MSGKIRSPVQILAWIATSAGNSEAHRKSSHPGRAMAIKDSLIAAMALVHGLTVVTRNRSDFEKTGLGIIGPFG